MANFPDIEPDGNAEWGIRTLTSTYESTLNGSAQHLQLPAAKWAGVLSFSNRGGAEARILRGFVFSLGGPAGRFDILPPDFDQQGSMAGPGVVDGADQTGKELTTGGWTPNQPALFEPGDYVGIDGELKMITERIASDGSGAATLKFAPPLRNSPANSSAIEVSAPRVTMYLESDSQARSQITPGLIYSLQLAVVEDIA